MSELRRTVRPRNLAALCSLFAFAALALPAVCLSQSVSLGWDPSTTVGVTNYVVYATTNSFDYYTRTNALMRIGVGTNLTATISDMQPARYNFTVTAMEGGMESTNSNIVVVDVPKPPPHLFTIVVQYLFSLTNNSATNLGFFKISTP